MLKESNMKKLDSFWSDFLCFVVLAGLIYMFFSYKSSSEIYGEFLQEQDKLLQEQRLKNGK